MMRKYNAFILAIMLAITLLPIVGYAETDDSVVGYWGQESTNGQVVSFVGYVFDSNYTGQMIMLITSPDTRPMLEQFQFTWSKTENRVIADFEEQSFGDFSANGNEYAFVLNATQQVFVVSNDVLQHSNGQVFEKITMSEEDKYYYGLMSLLVPLDENGSAIQRNASDSTAPLNIVGTWIHVDEETDDTNVFILKEDNTFVLMQVNPNVTYTYGDDTGYGIVIVLKGTWTQAADEIQLSTAGTKTFTGTLNNDSQAMSIVVESQNFHISIEKGNLFYGSKLLIKVDDLQSVNNMGVSSDATPDLETTPVSSTPSSSATPAPTDRPDYSNQISASQMYSNRIAVGLFHTGGIQASGRVLAVGNRENSRCDLTGPFVKIVAGSEHSVGLKSDGTVVARGKNDANQCRTSAWSNIVDIAAGDRCTVGVRRDGTVVATTDSRSAAVSSWCGIIAVDANRFTTVGLKSDGTVVTANGNFADTADWKGIVAIELGEEYFVGLRQDGTILVSKFYYGNVEMDESWSAIIDVACYRQPSAWNQPAPECIVGLTVDGRIVTTSDDPSFVATVSQWQNIVAIEGGSNLVAITSEGQVLTAGPNVYDHTYSRESFIYPPANSSGRNDVDNWDLID